MTRTQQGRDRDILIASKGRPHLESRDGQVMQLPVIQGRKKQRDCDRKLSRVMESGEWEARDRASGENNNRVLTEGDSASASNEHTRLEDSLQVKDKMLQ